MFTITGNVVASASTSTSSPTTALKRKSSIVIEEPSAKRDAVGNNNDTNELLKHCTQCNIDLPMNDWKKHVSTQEHINKATAPYSSSGLTFRISGVYGNRISRYIINNPQPHNLNLDEFYTNHTVMNDIRKLMEEDLQKHTAIKFKIKTSANYVKPTVEPEEEIPEPQEKTFFSRFHKLAQSDDIEEIIKQAFEQMRNESEEFMDKDSGWALQQILNLELNINKYEPLGGSSYMKLPKFVKAKKACINPVKYDDHCFQWAIRAYFLHEHLKVEYNRAIQELTETLVLTDLERETRKNKLDCKLRRQLTTMSEQNAQMVDEKYNLRWTDAAGDVLEYPMKLSDIKEFEATNRHISINVFSIDLNNQKTIIGPLHASKTNNDYFINLLLFGNEDFSSTHYVWIKDLSRLVSSQIDKHQHKKYICNFCFAKYRSSEELESHQNDSCLKIVTTFPKSSLSFDMYKRKIPVPFVILADSECCLQKFKDCKSKTDKPCMYSYN